ERAEQQRLELVREQAARASAEAGREWLRAVVETSPAGVVVTEAGTRRVQMANNEWRRVYGVAPGATVTREHLERATYKRPDGGLYGEDESPEMRALLRGETTRAEEVSIVFDDGRELPALVSATPLVGLD